MCYYVTKCQQRLTAGVQFLAIPRFVKAFQIFFVLGQ